MRQSPSSFCTGIPPPDTTSLVSNTYQQYSSRERVVGRKNSKQFSRAIGFRTGSDPAGYTLWSVDARVVEFEAGSSPRVTIRSANSSGEPAAELCALNNPARLQSGTPYNSQYVPTVIINTGAMNTFTAPGGCLLDADTDYFVMFEDTGTTSTARYRLKVTGSNEEDSGEQIGGMSGWTIGNVTYRRPSDTGSWDTEYTKLHIAIEGTVGNTVSQNQDTESDPPTVALQARPASHDGSSAFTVRLAFNEDVDIGAAAMRDHALTVSGGTVTAAQPVDGSQALWDIAITPTVTGDVTVLVPANRPCTEPGALCTADGRALAVGLALRIPHAPVSLPPLTAAFSAAPAEHDGSSRFTVGLTFSEEVKAGGRKVKAALAVTGGTAKKARRVAPPSNEQWTIRIKPDGHGAVSVLLPATTDCDATGAICTADGRKLSGPLTVTVAGPPGLSVADAQVQEGPGASLAFAVTLDRAPSGTVTVDYATSDGTATAGEDYTAASGMLSFAAGETAKTVTVAVLDDAHDEGNETLTLTLSNPSGAYIADGESTGTIENSDHMPAAWLARFGRTVADQVLEAVDGRMTAARVPGVEVTLAGQRIGAGDRDEDAEAREEEEARAKLAALGDWLRNDAEKDAASGPGSRSVAARELLTGSSFALTGEPGAGGNGVVALWGRGTVSRFDGREGELTLDGEVVSGMLGTDWTRGPWTAGLLLSHSRGSGGYRGAGSGTVESTLTGFYPYGRYEVNERLSAWAVAGYGAGTLSLTPEGARPIRTDMDLTMGALGVRGVALEAPAEGGVELAVKSDALVVQTGSEEVRGSGGNLAAAEATVTRLRLGLEGTWRGLTVGGGTLVPRAEIGVRHDGGDAETGFGLDLGAGLAWSDPKAGLRAEVRGRGLLTHESRGFRDRGVSGAFSWEPARGTPGRGPKLTLTQTLGASAGGGADALLGRGTLEGLGANDNGDDLGRGRLEIGFGYGFSAFGDGFTSTPELGVGLTDTGRDYRLGWRLTRDARGAGALEFSVDATRRESANDNDPEHGIGFRVTARW